MDELGRRANERFKEIINEDPKLKEIYNILAKNGLTEEWHSGIEVPMYEVKFDFPEDKSGTFKIWYESVDDQEGQERTELLQRIFADKDFVKVQPPKQPKYPIRR